ncbi:hypothetical protein ABZ924_21955 [Streptomyces sp. NPDC046876]|uniref:hypothetical protein n=1 Tax=Streptomyces sp. NPDC046876 TaxID=3155616 RepID=UPI0033F6F711
MTQTKTHRTAQLSAAGERGTGAALLVASLMPALFCYFMLAVQLPYENGRHAAYTAARQCPTDETVREREDCVRTVSFTVDAVQLKGGRGSQYSATVSGAAFWNGKVDFGDPGPLLERLNPQDQVTGTIWRGAVMTIAKGDVRQNSADKPRDEAQIFAGIGTYAGLVAALCLWFGAMRLSGQRRLYEPHTWRGLGRPLLIALAVICAAVAVPAFLLGIPWWVVPAVTVPFSAYTAWQFDRYRRRQATTAGTA